MELSSRPSYIGPNFELCVTAWNNDIHWLTHIIQIIIVIIIVIVIVIIAIFVVIIVIIIAITIISFIIIIIIIVSIITNIIFIISIIIIIIIIIITIIIIIIMFGPFKKNIFPVEINLVWPRWFLCPQLQCKQEAGLSVYDFSLDEFKVQYVMWTVNDSNDTRNLCNICFRVF